MNILVLNAGSSTLKYRLIGIDNGPGGQSVLFEKVLVSGAVEDSRGAGIESAAEKAIEECRSHGIDALAHRVVHGGSRFSEPTHVTPEVVTDLRGLRDLDPLHNPTETALIETGLRLLPAIPSIAAFDTAFHGTIPEISWRYALPRDLADRLGLRRFGFHGISYEYVSGRLLECLGRSPEGTRLVVCHLGSGASVCAIRDGKSVDTSMGLTPLEGLVMGTRSGDVDPGLLLYLLRSGEMTVETIDDLLNHQSGLLGLSGSSGDVRELERAASNGGHDAEMALELFAYRACKYIAAYAAAMEGVDAIAFTGGIGEHSADMRARISRRMSFMGITVDSRRNENTGPDAARISADSAAVQIWVIPTDEERQIARAAFRLLTTPGGVASNRNLP